MAVVVPHPSATDRLTGFVPPPPRLPAHLSRSDSGGATHGGTIAVEVSFQLRRGVVDSQGRVRVLSVERNRGVGVDRTFMGREQVDQESARQISGEHRNDEGNTCVGYERQWGYDRARHAGAPIPQPPSSEFRQCVSAFPQTPIGTRVPRGPPPATRPSPPLPSDVATANIEWLRKASNVTSGVVRPEGVNNIRPRCQLDPSSGLPPCIA